MKQLKIKGSSKKYKYSIISMLTLVGFLLIWQFSVQFGIVSEKVLATPIEVIQAFLDKLTSPNPDGSTIGQNILASMSVSVTGFLISIIIGVPLGLLMGWYKPLDKFIRPIFEIVRPIPPVAWIPIAILWLGFGFKAKLFIIVFGAFIPCVINSYAGIRLTSKNLVDVATTCGASNFETFRKVGVPFSLPLVFAGVRIALSSSWGALVAAEMLASNAGLGNMIVMGRQFVRTDIIILGMIVIGFIGFTLNAFFKLIEKRMLKGRLNQ